MSFKFSVLSVLMVCIISIPLSFKIPVSPVETIFHQQVSLLINELKTFSNSAQNKEDLAQLKGHFVRSRLLFKKSSILSDYFFPGLLRSINGPDLRFAEDDNPDNISEPHGFQVIERILFSNSASVPYTLLQKEVSQLEETFRSMNEQPGVSDKFRNELVFDALRSANIRLVTLGITGFDSPVSLNSLEESIAVLEGMEEILSGYKEEECLQMIAGAKKYISAARDFNSFNRLKFIKEFADPLYSQLVHAGKSKGFVLPDERRPLNQYSTSIFSPDLFDITFFSPNQRYQVTAIRAVLGKSLFYDSIFSLSVKRSCATCHDPSKAFTDGLRFPVGINSSAKLKRNTPTLTGAVYQTHFFYDSRTATLENQLNSVVHNVDEMNGSLVESITRIRQHPEYLKLFQKSYPNDGEPVTEYNIANAISSYIRSLPTFNSPFDRYMNGKGRLTQKETEGFNLFAGKAKCATCHYIPLFNGLVPPQFTETESEVIGVPETTGTAYAKLDDDLGKFLFTRSAIHKYSFKTPTLRNITITAPYMHNGVFRTLEAVIDFYNKGGGSGIHTAPENQTLPADELHLSRKEIKSIIAFLGTLTDRNAQGSR